MKQYSNQLAAFADARIEAIHEVVGRGNKNSCCYCPPVKEKGNNGIGQEKRGILDGPPPGLAKQPRQDFNDRSGNRHGVEV